MIGDPIEHSLSPLLHNSAFDALGLDWVSVAFPVPAGGAVDALAGMRALGIIGLSVTMPHKEQVFAAVDRCTDVARRLGAVNCVTRVDDALLGDSTDGEGLMAALRRAVAFDARSRRCVVIGAGGAARAVVLALAGAGAAEVAVVNRTPAKADVAASLAGAVGRMGTPGDVAGADLVVQATPVGMGGVLGEGAVASIDTSAFRPDQLVVDLVYHPRRTAFLEAAAQRGAVVLNGLGMLVHQAALAVERWTGCAVPVEAMWAAAQAHLDGH